MSRGNVQPFGDFNQSGWGEALVEELLLAAHKSEFRTALKLQQI